MPILRPELFQGARRRRRYFEGWYFKQVSADGKAWSFIPGVSMDARGRREAFVQAIDGSTGKARWYSFPFEEFAWDARALNLRVGANRFSLSGVELDLDGPDGRVAASLRFGPVSPYPGKPWRPGIMGPYSFVPFMECSHGLVSLDHRVDGSVEADGSMIPMDGGRGYIEKDWGSSMPKAWIWCQSNSFPERGVSASFSLADVPWLGRSFAGFLCAVRIPRTDASRGYASRGGSNGRSEPVATQSFDTLTWATWNGSRLDGLSDDGGTVKASVIGPAGRLSLSMGRGRGGLLRAPDSGSMARRIAESVDAELSIALTLNGSIAYSGTAWPAGLETVGDLSCLGMAAAASIGS